MKKLIFVFAIIMTFGCFTNSYAGNDEMEVLRLLEIIPDYYDYNADENFEITRADFVAAAAKLIGTKLTEKNFIYYYDVPTSHWAYNEISLLTEMKILNGTGDKLFRPDDKMTKAEACKIILSLMDFDELAEIKGGYPNGYISVAAEKDLLEGVSSSEYVTLSDMFMLLYNTMITEIEDDDKTLLSIYRNVYYLEGKLAGADCVTVGGESIPERYVLVDEELYECDLDVTDYLGEDIKFFYCYNKNADEKRVLWASRKDDDDNLYITVDNDAFFDDTTYKFTYHDAEKEKSIYLNRGITVLYNGGIVDKNISDVLKKPRYTVKFTEDDSLAIVESYENLVVGKIDTENKTVYDKNNPGRKLILDEQEYEKVILERFGKDRLSFEDIKVGDVLSVFMSYDEKYLKVQVSKEKISGKVEQVQNSENRTKIYIDGTVYLMSDISGRNFYAVGDNVTAYLDFNGEITYIKINEKDNNAVFIIKAIKDSDGTYNTKFKVLKENGEIVLLECGAKVRIDGVTYQEQDEIFELFKEGQIAVMGLNNEQKIATIDTVVQNENESVASLSVNVPFTSGLEYRHTGIIGAKSVINDDTVIFAVPLAYSNNDDDYKVISKSILEDKEYLNAETYKTKEKAGIEQYVVLKGYDSEKYSTDSIPVLVDSITTIVNEEGSVVECIKGYQGNTEVDFPASSDTPELFSKENIKAGSLIWLRVNSKGEVLDLKHLFDITDMSIYKFDSNIDAEYRTTYAYVNDIVEGVIKLGYNSPETIDQVLPTDGIPVLTFESGANRNTIKVSNISDAVTFYNEGETCSKVVVITKWRNPKLFVIYK